MDIRTINGTRYYSGEITPGEGIVFVFGSNPEGRHGAGAAKVAREQFGAIYGQGEGLQGNAYALPTKDLRVKENRSLRSISPEAITENVRRLYETARQNPDKTFCIAYRNTDRQSLNGYTGIEMMRMFAAAGPLPENILVSEEWYNAGKEILSYESVQKQDKGLTLDELLNFHSGSMSQYVDDNLATANRPFEEVMGDALSNTVRDALERGDNPAVVRLWAERAMKENDMTEEQLNSTLGKVSGTVQSYIDLTNKKDMEQNKNNSNIRKIVRELAHDIIGESSDMVELPGSVEIDVHASDTSHYHVCGARFDTKEQDYVFSAYRGYPYEDDVDVIREIAVKDMDIEDVESLAKSDIFQSAKKIASEKEKNESVVTFVEDDSPYYKERTRRNAEAADVTIAFAVDFNTAGEKCTRNVAGDKYVAINLPPLTYYKNPDNIFNRAMLKERVEKIEAEIIQLSDKYGFLPVEVNVNVAGNGLYTLAQHGISQADVDLFVTNVFRLIEGRPNIHVSSIRSGGQTGIDEAGIKAAAALDIQATVLAPKGWKFRDESGKDISDEKAFKARFPEGPVKKNGMIPLTEEEMLQTSGGVRVDEPKKQAESGMKPLSEEEMRNTRGGVEVAQQPASPADTFKRIAEAAVASGKVKSVGELKDGWALVQASNGKYNFADAKGQFMTKRWLDKATEFSNGFATVERDGCKARINTGGIAVEVKNNMVQKTGNSPKIG